MFKVGELVINPGPRPRTTVEVRGEILMTGLRCFLIDFSDEVWKVRDIEKFFEAHPAVLLKCPGLGFALASSPWATMGGDWSVVRDVSATGTLLPSPIPSSPMMLQVSSVSVNVSKYVDHLEVFDQDHIERMFQARLRSTDSEVSLTSKQRAELKDLLATRRQAW